ncbi:MAG: hypothetical protein U0469_01680 [Candidatus Paceibacterota bacterium]|jgi:pyruvate/2-oxoacid:ferredoxin oxidoreductase alpha subunit
MKKEITIKNKDKSIEELVLEFLQKGSISSVNLIKEISKERKSSTKQGVYRVLRKLAKEEKIIIHNKNVSLNLHYIKKMNNFYNLAQYYYLPQISNYNNFLGLVEKEKIIYKFKDLNQLDSFWTHVFYMLNEIIDSKNPIYFYNPHNWFTYVRKDTDEGVIHSTKNKSRQIFLTVSHDDYLDRKAKNILGNEYYQFNIDTKFSIKKDNYYVCVIGDYITEIYIDKNITKEIDKFFIEAKDFRDTEKNILEKIISQRSNNKLIISRSKKKAEELKKILGKDFYIKK